MKGTVEDNERAKLRERLATHLLESFGHRTFLLSGHLANESILPDQIVSAIFPLIESELARIEAYQQAVAVRPALAKFALAMEKELKRNDHKGGWEEEDPDYLFQRLREEVEELERAYVSTSRPARVKAEAADVANFAMMLADNFERNADE